MREILFRGKTTRTGQWVFGYYTENYGTGRPQIREKAECCFTEVIPDTVGQYTGLTDKNGKKIFEGDIVDGYDFSEDDGGYGFICFNDGAFEVNGTNDNNICGTFHENYYGKDFEVIGNIHDNPELLKGGAE